MLVEGVSINLLCIYEVALVQAIIATALPLFDIGWAPYSIVFPCTLSDYRFVL